MAQLILRAILSNNRRRIASTDDDRRPVLRSLDRRVQQRFRPTSELRELKYARGTVPEDRLCGEDSLLEELSTLLASV